MTGRMRQYARVFDLVARDRSSRRAFVVTGIAFFILSVLLFVATIPGNSLWFQFSIFTLRDYALLTVLAALFGLQTAVQVYAWKTRRASRSLQRGVVQNVVPAASGLFAAAAGTAACSLCLASLFGLVGLGMGSVLFVLEHRAVLLLAAIGLMVGSLLFVVRKVATACEACAVQTDSHAGFKKLLHLS